MTPSISQRISNLNGLREQVAQATAEFYQKASFSQPARSPRFGVVPQGCNTYEVRDRATGESMGDHFGNQNALQAAQQLERSNCLHPDSRELLAMLGSITLRWTALMSITLVLFAYFGADR